MSRRRKDDGNGCLIFVIVVLGIPLFLLMEHPVICFLVFFPLVCWGYRGFNQLVQKIYVRTLCLI